MRLLHVQRFELAEFSDDEIPKYVIASHRWRKDAEATFQDVQNGRDTDRSGYKKIEAFARHVRDHMPHVEWLWIDTCCIDKTNAAELSEAINLMFKWYRNAQVCLTYLVDVKAAEDKAAFRNSEWFQRGWTLQELLAPRMVTFLAENWAIIGNKGVSRDGGTPVELGLEKEIAAITRIPERVLYNYDASRSLSVDEKRKWMEGRTTTRDEDMVYALYGICGVTPGANYGEGYEGAQQRLSAAIDFRDNLTAPHSAKFRKIVEWLALSDPWINHQSARERHEPQTGTWFLESDDYRAWKFGLIRHLWVYGKAGCGKTVLCSAALEDVMTHCENSTDGYAIFYLCFSDDRKRMYKDLLLSMVEQIGWREPSFAMLQQEFERPDRRVPRVEDIEKAVLSSIETYENFFLLLDALDESPEDNDARQDMTDRLTTIASKAPRLRILVTSRELPDIRASMAKLKARPMPVSPRYVDADIKQYVASELLRHHRLSGLTQETKTLIGETLSTKADGMFRWAYCQLYELKRLKSTRPSSVRRALYALPSTLDETYERMLTGIDENLRPDALTLLRWLTYAKSPPSLEELVEATIIDTTAEGSVEVEDRPGLGDALDILSGLVVITGIGEDDDALEHDQDTRRNKHKFQDNGAELTELLQEIKTHTRIKLAHFSVKEYLESSRILQTDAREFHLESGREHRTLSQSCLIYLAHYSSTEESGTLPLLQYAAEAWSYHSALQRTSDFTREIGLLTSETFLRDWLSLYLPDYMWDDNHYDPRIIGSALYYASVLGLEQVVSKLLEAGEDVIDSGGNLGGALQAATLQGHERTIRILIDAGADVNIQEWFDGLSALHVASLFGNEKVVQMLLNAGAVVNARGRKGETALMGASLHGSEKVAQMLLDAGADVDAQAYSGETALIEASLSGSEKVVQTLLDAGADVDAQAYSGETALIEASLSGSEKVVQTLLDAGADLDAQTSKGRTALIAASTRGFEKVAQMLLDAGADSNMQTDKGYTALIIASRNGHKKVVQVLLDAGADVDAQGRRGDTALMKASSHGYKKVVQALLDAGADVNAQERTGVTALTRASLEGHEKIVQMLLDAGADSRAQGEHFGTALQAACFTGRVKVVSMLLDDDARVLSQEGPYGDVLQTTIEGFHSALQTLHVNLDGKLNGKTAAEQYRSELQPLLDYDEIIGLLIGAGAGTSLDFACSSVLCWASLKGDEENVRILLAAGADTNTQLEKCMNALQAASMQGHERIVRILLDNGANVNVWKDYRGSALQLATEGNHEKVVKVLLDAGAQAIAPP